MITEPFGNTRSSAKTLALPSGSTRTSTAALGASPPIRSHPKLPTYARPCVVDDHVVEVAAAVLGQVGVHGHRARVTAAQDRVVGHRDHEQRAVRHPAEAGRLAFDLQHHFGVAVGVDGLHRVRVEVGDPPAPVAPARRLEEVAVLEQRAQLTRSHSRDPTVAHLDDAVAPDGLDQRAVVGRDHERPAVGAQRRLDHLQRVEVEVVGRLVEQDQLGAARRRSRPRARAPARPG